MINNELKKRILSSILIIPISFFFILKGSNIFLLFLIFFFLVSSYEWVRMNNEIKLKLFGILYLFVSFYLTYLLREQFPLNIFFLILIICIFTDLGGYIFGKLFKGPKLTKISPNKTYSGMIGSYVLTLLSLIIFNNLFLEETFNLKNNAIYNLLIFGTVVSFISQLGDLVISYFKRIYKIKDTGKIIPGHGGLLDRIDGMIFAFPISFLLNIF